MVHDFSKDDGLTPGDLYGLAERYKAFSGSQLQAYTLPTAGATSAAAGSVEVVQPDEAAPIVAQFQGGDATTITTPPLDAYGRPISIPVNTTTTTPAPTTSSPSPAAPATTAPAPPTIPPYDPRPC